MSLGSLPHSYVIAAAAPGLPACFSSFVACRFPGRVSGHPAPLTFRYLYWQGK
jgi:hypothetical protein